MAQRLTGARAFEVLADQRPHCARVEEPLTAHRGATGLHEVAVDVVLEHISRCAGADRLEQILLVVVHRQHDHADLRPAMRDLPRRLQPGLAWHQDVEHREVDVFRERASDGLVAVRGLGDDREVGLGVEDPSQPTQDDRVVVSDEDVCRW
jgi:hypothetical protein